MLENVCTLTAELYHIWPTDINNSKGSLFLPNFDTIIKEKKSTYNGNKFCYLTEKVNNSALITV